MLMKVELYMSIVLEKLGNALTDVIFASCDVVKLRRTDDSSCIYVIVA